MDPLEDILGQSGPMVGLRRRLHRLLESAGGHRPLPSLFLRGETGTGKGLVARTVHRASSRRDRPFVQVNCAAIPEGLLEAELFGFERGAFTGAYGPKPGLFHAAHRGILFLDEVGLLPVPLQGKLLAVLDDQRVRRLGSTRTETVDAWVVAATSLDIETTIMARGFRADLYHRLSVVSVELPPLRERGEDILLLADHLLARAVRTYELRPKTLSSAARQALRQHSWPGNVRELANTIERAVLLSNDGVISVEHLAIVDAGSKESAADQAGASSGIRETMERYEREQLFITLERSQWNVARAAEKLGVPRNTLRYRIAKYDLKPHGGWRRTPPRMTLARPAVPDGPAEGSDVQSAPPPTVLPGAPTRTVTFLRVTLEAAGLELPGVPDRLVDRIAHMARRFGGCVVTRQVWDLDAAFGLDPSEDAPARAAAAALAIRDLVQHASVEAPRPRLRMALTTRCCEVMTSPGEPQLRPDTQAQISARLSDLIARAPANSIVVCASAATLIQRRYRVESHLEHAASS